jgi:hypothetical protein
MTSDATLAKRWPKTLVERIADRDYLLVAGAGVSASCKNAAGGTPPSWKQLLNTLATEFTSGNARKEVLRLIAQENFLDAAELIKSQAVDKGKGKDFTRLISERTDGKKPDNFQPGDLHDLIMRLDPRILITTNYDALFERASGHGYRRATYEATDAGHEVRTGAPLLLKVHGTVDEEQRLILTRADYTEIRRTGRNVLSLLEALFMTRTALFMGYSLSDPDMQLVLENNLSRRADTGAHYMLTGDGVPNYHRTRLLNSFGVELIHYKNRDYAEQQRMLELLADLVDAQRAAVLGK